MTSPTLAEHIRIAQGAGDLRPEVDPQQLAFELYAPLELANYLATLYRDPSRTDRGRASARATLAAASPNQPTTR